MASISYKKVLKASPERKKKKRILHFKQVNETNMYKHFYIKKEIASLNRYEIAVYLALCAISDFEKNIYKPITINYIAHIAGVSKDKVRENIQYLKEKNLLKVRIPDGSSVHQYKVKFIRKTRKTKDGEIITLSTALFETGVWSKLTPSAKQLYLVLRASSHYPLEAIMLFNEIDGYEVDEWVRENVFPCFKINKTINHAAKQYGFSSTSLMRAKKELKDAELLVWNYYIWRKPVNWYIGEYDEEYVNTLLEALALSI